jgi:hypothetical protein
MRLRPPRAAPDGRPPRARQRRSRRCNGARRRCGGASFAAISCCREKSSSRMRDAVAARNSSMNKRWCSSCRLSRVGRHARPSLQRARWHVRRLLSERIAVVPTQSSDRRSCDGSNDRVASTDDRRHDGSQPLVSNPTILRLRGCQVGFTTPRRKSGRNCRRCRRLGARRQR